jgi:hypothetical protein
MAIQHRRGTAAAATAANVVLAIGQLGVETDTGKIKVGDGTRAWNLLPYSQATTATTSTSALRMTAPDGGLWDLTAASDGIPVTTAATGTEPGVNAVNLKAPGGAVWSYSVANDGVLVFAAVV